MARTHYEVLGITHAASTEEIRRAFRAAARKLHPDVSESKNSETRFAEASAAYEVLSDPQARRAYDEQLHAARTSHEGVPSGQAHYTWTNVATHATKEGGERGVGQGDLDEMYNAFFGKSKRTRKPKA